MLRIFFTVCLALWLPTLAWAERVAPSERVRSRVIVRSEPQGGSRPLASLRPGETAVHRETLGGWRRIALADGSAGFVSAAWTVVIPDPPDPAARRDEGRSLLGRLREAIAPSSSVVEFAIRDPEPGQRVYRHTDPTLPVSGDARVPGAGVHYDIVLALDVSTSTNEASGGDADGDGRIDSAWKGEDSIFAAQVTAARRFVRAVGELPRNQQGERIRIGVVSYAGAERFHHHPDDARDGFSGEDVFRLGMRDASLRVPLTSDYGRVERALRELARLEPVGMTDTAAGLGRAIIELERGSESPPREGAQKVVLLLTDGKPRLPHDPETAERAALHAGRLAAELGIRVNAFTLGRNAVTRAPNRAVRRMARRTGGSYVELERPGDIVEALESTPFSIVDRVALRNRTTGEQTSYITTGIDGSFYGELDLAPGTNRIEITAVLDDGREASELLEIEYVEGLPAAELAEQLKRIRLENEALIERIKQRITRQMAREREQQRKSLEVRAEDPPGPASPR